MLTYLLTKPALSAINICCESRVNKIHVGLLLTCLKDIKINSNQVYSIQERYYSTTNNKCTALIDKFKCIIYCRNNYQTG